MSALGGLYTGSVRQRDTTGHGQRKILVRDRAELRELALCQLLLLPTDQMWEPGAPGCLPVSSPRAMSRKLIMGP